MFSTSQIVSATYLMRNFARLAARVREGVEPLLIAQKGKKFMVLVSAEIFEDLVRLQYEARQAGFLPRSQFRRE